MSYNEANYHPHIQVMNRTNDEKAKKKLLIHAVAAAEANLIGRAVSVRDVVVSILAFFRWMKEVDAGNTLTYDETTTDVAYQLLNYEENSETQADKERCLSEIRKHLTHAIQIISGMELVRQGYLDSYGICHAERGMSPITECPITLKSFLSENPKWDELRKIQTKRLNDFVSLMVKNFCEEEICRTHIISFPDFPA